MHAATRRVFVPLIALLALLFAAPAVASAQPNSYVTQVANSLRSNHVYVDSSSPAVVSADQARQLSSQIASTHKPIYLAFVNASRSGETSAQAFLADLHRAMGVNGVVGISTSKGFYAAAFGEPHSIATQVDSLSSQDASQIHGPSDLYPVYSRWISQVASLHSSGSSSGAGHTVVVQQQPKSHTGLIVFLVILGVLVLGVAAFFGIRAYNRSRRSKEEETERHDELQVRYDDLVNRHEALFNDVQLHDDAKADYGAAQDALGAAEKSLSKGLLDATEEYLDRAESHYDKANRRVQGVPEPVAAVLAASTVSASASRPPLTGGGYASSASSGSGNRQSSSGVRARRPDGSTVVINNTTYAPQPMQRAGYSNYWGGGYYGGMYYGPGYYQDPFWNFMMLDALTDDFGRGDDYAYRDGYQDAMQNQQFDGNDGAASYGGGDFGGQTDYVESNDDASDFGGGNFGSSDQSGGDSWGDTSGGGDFGSDSGGGDSWGDSGGGDFGGGDTSGGGDF